MCMDDNQLVQVEPQIVNEILPRLRQRYSASGGGQLCGRVDSGLQGEDGKEEE